MANLNSQQSAVVEEVLNGTSSINVVARAGTGKTYLLVNGICRTIAANNLGSVALMAFNKSIATEFEKRLDALSEEYNEPELLNIDTGTVHSFGFRFWRSFAGGRMNVNNSKTFDIIQSLKTEDKYPFTSQVIKLVSLAKQAIMTPTDLAIHGVDIIEHHDIDANGSSDEIVQMAVDVLRVSNTQKQIIDFDDMIYLPVLNKVPTTQYDFVLVDEAQDTNKARRMLATMMLRKGGRFIAVGDDRQAIYGFTGADSDSMDIIASEFDSKIFPLTLTYRCPQTVVKEANRLVPDLQAHESNPAGVVRTIPSLIEVN